MAHPPSGWTVTSASRSIGDHSGLVMCSAGMAVDRARSVSALWSKMGRSPTAGQSTRTPSSTKLSVPSPTSSLITRYVSDRSAGPPVGSRAAPALEATRRATRWAKARGLPPSSMSAATAKAAGMSMRRAPGMAPSSISAPLPGVGLPVRSTAPVMQGPTVVSAVTGRRPAPMPRMGWPCTS